MPTNMVVSDSEEEDRFSGLISTSPGLLTSDDDDEAMSARALKPVTTVALTKHADLLGRRRLRRLENEFFFFHHGLPDLHGPINNNNAALVEALCADFAAMQVQEQLEENPFFILKSECPQLFDQFFEGEIGGVGSRGKRASSSSSSADKALMNRVDRRIRPVLRGARRSELVHELERVLLSPTGENGGSALSGIQCERILDPASGQTWLQFEFQDAVQRKVAMGVAQYYGVPFQSDRRGRVKLRLDPSSATAVPPLSSFATASIIS